MNHDLDQEYAPNAAAAARAADRARLARQHEQAQRRAAQIEAAREQAQPIADAAAALAASWGLKQKGRR